MLSGRIPQAFRALKPAYFLLILLAVNPLSELAAATFSVVNTNDSGAGSFRQSLNNANTNSGSHSIFFQIPGNGPFSIRPATPLPGISNVVFIDGTSQSNYAGLPLIELNGSNAGSGANGLHLLSSNCTIRGLAINRFLGDGICIEGTGGNTIQANFIGTGVYGTNALGNGYAPNSLGGISVLSPNNLIGGLDLTNRNLISGNMVNGIYLRHVNAVGNIIQGNLIGTDIGGTSRLPNFTNGIVLLNAASNLIGGTVAGARNLISGNGQSGIYFFDNANYNVVQGNFIGVNTTGTAALSNAADGITFAASVVGPKYNLIGGNTNAARNLISGNGGRGVVLSSPSTLGNLIAGNYIGTSSNGLVAISNAFNGVEMLNSASNSIGGSTAAAGNLISGNGLAGVKIGNLSGSGHIVQNNLIGTDATGTNALPNNLYGIIMFGVTGNQIGPSNVISGNKLSGVLVSSNATANIIQGNLIGPDRTGLRRLGNTLSGVQIESPSNTIGGLTASARNVISGNTNNGIYLIGPTGSNTLVQGNFIGTDINGTAALANSIAGIYVTASPGNTIGGLTPTARNIISGNANQGIYLVNNATTGNLIQGNYIGTDLTGSAGIANGSGYVPLAPFEVAGGVDIDGAPGNTIGGTNSGAGNLISANWRDAIAIGGTGASNNVIQGNLIGVKIDGVSPLGNEWASVEIRSAGGGGGTIIGGITPGAANIIANTRQSDFDGVRIRSGPGNQGILIRGNSIFGNNASSLSLGIDLDLNGVTANDGCDTDTGANQLQNFPLLTGSLTTGGVTRVSGTLNSIASRTYQLDFYANTATNVSGYGEGQFYLGSTNVITDGSCNGSFTFIVPAASVPGQFITATATDATNNTSEFSAAVTVNAPTISVQPVSRLAPPGTNVTFSVTAAGTGTLSYQWRTNGVPRTGATASSLVLIGVSTNDSLNYDVIITNTFGAVTSSVATLAVGFAPAITQSPLTQTNLAGTNVTLTVAASGTAPLAYQWRTNGIPRAGATASALVLNSVTTNDALNYDAIVTNIFGAATSSVATLVVVAAPAIVQQPQSQTNIAGTTAIFSVTASGTAPLAYQWRTNGIPRVGATNATLTLSSVATNDALNYDIIVTNLYGAATSSVATLTVNQAPVITQSPQSQTNVAGSTAVFSVNAGGTAPLRYQWRTNGVPRPGATNTSLTLSSVTLADALNYDVVVTNNFGAATSAVAALTVINYTPTLTTISSNGVPTNRINLILLAEGYRTNELTQFLVDAANVASNLLATPPFDEYRNYFNTYAISVASTDSGSDHYTPSVSLKNTYFNSSYDSYNLPQLVTIPPNDRDANPANGTAKIQNLLTNAAVYLNQPWATTLLPRITPTNRLVILVVNDPSYGGSGQPPEETNPLPIAVTSLGTSGGVAALDIIAHESGHTLADLADEYSTTFPGHVPTEHANATTQTNFNLIPWKSWINNGVPLPTPDTVEYSGFVGLFAGAQYQTNGWYRPKRDCKMNHLGVPFCEVCSEAIVRAINRKVRLLETYTPATNNNSLTASTDPAIPFTVTPLQPTTHSLNLQWFTNGVAVPGATATTYLFNPLRFTNGPATLQVRGIDATPLVRTDPGNVLSNAVSWNVNIALTRLQLVTPRWLTNGQFTFAITGAAPYGYVVQATTNFLQWTPIATNPPLNGGLNFTNAAGFPHRFFRTIYAP